MIPTPALASDSIRRSPSPLPRLLIVDSFLPGFELQRYPGGALAHEWAVQGAQVITTSHFRFKLLRLADMLRTTLMRRKEYDIGHVTVFSGQAFRYAECVVELLRILRKPCTLGLHGGSLTAFAARHPHRIRRLLTQAALVASPSRYLLEELKPFCLGLRLVPNALHISGYPKRSIAQAGPSFLWLRAFHKIYNPEMAPALLQRILPFLPDASLTMVGPDKGDGSLQATRNRARELGVLNRVKLPGPVPKNEVPQVMSQHDVFINTTNIDNMPLSVIEALACGLPVVSTNVGGIPYLLEHGKTGLLVNPGDTEAMAQAVWRLVTTPGLASQLSQNGRKLAESFDWSVVLPLWKRFFEQSIAASNP
jgi:glycosyltransferase involved in cell wall biosynthesis